MLPVMAKALRENGVKLRGTAEAAEIIKRAYTADGQANGSHTNAATDSQNVFEIMGDDDFNTEYLDLVLSVKIVNNVQEAISHINHFGSHHTDCIVTENADTADLFMQLVDSAEYTRTAPQDLPMASDTVSAQRSESAQARSMQEAL